MRKTSSTTLAAFSLLFAAVGISFAADITHPTSISEVRDFSRLGDEIQRKRVPLVLMFSAEYCSYCIRVENDFLIPMQISGDYTDRAVIRQVKIDFGNEVVDFKGKRVDADEFAARYNITVTPTLVFLDHRGNQLATKRVGLMTPDFYGGYLDESIATALDILRRNKPLRVTLDD